MPIQWAGRITSPTQLAGVIQGEAATPAGQFAVASVMYNRLQNGGFGASLPDVVTPTQFNGYQTPGANALSLANDLWNGSPPSGGDPGNALYFANPVGSTASWPSSLPGSGAVNIGGNWFSDQMGPPSSSFLAPSYGGASSQIALGPGDASSGLAAGPSGGDYLTGNVDPTYGDLTQYQVAGVNAPLGSTGSGSSTTSQGGGFSTTGSGSSSTSKAPSSSSDNSVNSDIGQGTPVTQGLQQGTLDAITKWIANIETSFGSGLKAALTAAETGAGTAFAGVENWFVRAGLIVLAIVLIAVGLIVLLWDHGGKETAGRIMEVAAA